MATHDMCGSVFLPADWLHTIPVTRSVGQASTSGNCVLIPALVLYMYSLGLVSGVPSFIEL